MFFSPGRPGGLDHRGKPLTGGAAGRMADQVKISKTIMIPIIGAAALLMADCAPARAADPQEDYPGEPGREVINTFVERERRREEDEAFRRYLDIWAAGYRRCYRGCYLSRELNRLLRWIENPRNKDCLPPPELCAPFYYPPFPDPNYSSRFLPRNYWRLMTQVLRRRQVEWRRYPTKERRE